MQQMLENLAPLVFVAAFTALLVAERLFAARAPAREPWRRRRNLALTAVNFIVGGAVGAATLAAGQAVAARGWGLAAASGWLPVVAGVLLLDLVDYARHRLSHAWPLLWRLHRVHHTDREVDVTTSLRSHPLEQAIRVLFDAGAVLLFGIAPLTLALHALLQITTLLLAHANLRLPAVLDRGLAWLVPTPALHLVHHSRRRAETDTNFGAILTAWDRLFGTFHAPAPAATGLDGCDGAAEQSVGGMLLSPWRSPA